MEMAPAGTTFSASSIFVRPDGEATDGTTWLGGFISESNPATDPGFAPIVLPAVQKRAVYPSSCCAIDRVVRDWQPWLGS